MSTIAATNLKNASSGSNNIVLATDGSATIATLSSTTITGTTIQGTIKSGTAVASTSGTSIDFTSIPSWVKRVTVMFSGISTNGTSNPMMQIGTSAGVEATGYLGAAGFVGAATAAGNFTTGFGLSFGTAATSTFHGVALLTGMGSNLWAFGFSGGYSSGANSISAGGAKTLAGALDRVRITTVNGTDTFDAGTINILYEG
jgi:hypothetical protein